MAAYGLPREWTLEAAELHTILSETFQALQDGSAEYIHSNPMYRWKWFQGAMTVARMRVAIEGIDGYLDESAQVSYVNNNHKDKGQFTKGPGLGRMSDEVMVAMCQRLDAKLAELYPGEKQGDTTDDKD